MKNIFIGITSIILGGVIYVLWREQTLPMFSWFNFMGLSTPIEIMRSSSRIFLPLIPDWFRFSLPNALWAFGGIFIFFNIWKNCLVEKYFWIFIFSTIAIGMELGQLIVIIPGTYDRNDMLVMIFFIIIALLHDINQHKEVKYVKNV